MSLGPARPLAHYRIDRKIGEGGMGESSVQEEEPRLQVLWSNACTRYGWSGAKRWGTKRRAMSRRLTAACRACSSVDSLPPLSGAAARARPFTYAVSLLP